MSWQSTTIHETQSHDQSRSSHFASIPCGMAVGMIFCHCKYFASISSGSTTYVQSWVLFLFTVGASLGIWTADKLIGSSRIHRWGLVGWTGLITGILTWLLPSMSKGTEAFWASSGLSSGFLLMPTLITSTLFGLVPGGTAGLAVGAEYQQPAKGHPQDPSKTGWFLVSGAFGYLLAEIFLIQKFGLEFSVPMTALVWLVIGAGGLILKARNQIQDLPSEKRAQPSYQGKTDGELNFRSLGIYLGLMAACLMIVWMRISDWVFGDTLFWNLYWPCVGLAITGIGFLFPIGTTKLTTRNLAFGLGLLGLLCLCLLFSYDKLPFWLSSLKIQLGDSTTGFPVHALVYTVVFGGLFMIPFYGIGCLTHFCQRNQTEYSQFSLGIQLIVTTSLLSVLIQHFLMDMLGLARIAGLGVGVAGSMAVFYAFQSHDKWRGLSRIASPVFGLLIISFIGSQFDKQWRLVFSQSDDLSTGFFSTREDATKWAYRSDQISYHESAYGSVAIHSYDFPGNSQLELRINGEVIERGFAHQIKSVINTMVPYVLHGSPENVAMFGLRSGSAAGILASVPSIKKLDGVEFIPDLLNVIGQFSNSNGNLMKRESFQFHNTTPTRFLNQNTEKYDLILNQYARPWRSCLTPWFTLEFYENCRNQLADDGFMIQNIVGTHLDDPTLETVLATFGSVFNQTSIWKLGHGEWMLIGSTNKREWSLDLLRKRTETREVKAILESQDLAVWPVLLTSQVSGFDNGFHLIPDEALIHSQKFPSLRLLGNHAYGAPSKLTIFDSTNEHFSPQNSLIIGQKSPAEDWTVEQLRGFSILQVDHQFYDPKIFRSIVRQWLKISPEETTLQVLSASTSNAESEWAFESARLNALIASYPSETEPPLELVKQAAYHALQTYRDQRSFFYRPDTDFLEAMLDHMIKKDPDYQRVYRMNLAELTWDQGKTESFLKLTEEAFHPETDTFGPVDYSADPMAPYRTLALMAEYWWRTGQLEKAKDICIQALQSKYIGPEAVFHHPKLEQSIRKILFALDLPNQDPGEVGSNLEIETLE